MQPTRAEIYRQECELIKQSCCSVSVITTFAVAIIIALSVCGGVFLSAYCYTGFVLIPLGAYICHKVLYHLIEAEWDGDRTFPESSNEDLDEGVSPQVSISPAVSPPPEAGDEPKGNEVEVEIAADTHSHSPLRSGSERTAGSLVSASSSAALSSVEQTVLTGKSAQQLVKEDIEAMQCDTSKADEYRRAVNFFAHARVNRPDFLQALGQRNYSFLGDPEGYSSRQFQ